MSSYNKTLRNDESKDTKNTNILSYAKSKDL